ncbi:uncharacterized protein BO87DRAFT_424598 [Aspergillus neoniger CBS 115656]|uniref:C6 transcription factor n=1 Tax=Aspergillus neoniger (strain CBS 115656) TaxID=1448310 RepID=A0A318ZI63_ASPNB|nr:hypothetical protein BO87DRAFT_424598 [Aspergillus neoniger CBS 115656]PYH35702.1 hypothetical protein BO87DRAFT_424598 [Aspergillus neoniger CBS 115656]
MKSTEKAERVVRREERQRKGRWRWVKFVNEDPTVGGDDVVDEDSMSDGARASGDETVLAPSRIGFEADNSDDSLHDSPAMHSSLVGSKAFSDRDKSAVHGLLALGTSDGVNYHRAAPDKGYEKTSSDFVSSELVASTPAVMKHAPSFVGSSERLPSSISANPITDTAKLKLLCHYRYHVAPWLDICDLTHPFGITAVQTALSSEPLMTALLDLSNACVIHKDMGKQQTSHLSRIDQLTRPLWSDSFTFAAENALTAVLEETRWLVTDIAQTWKNMQNLRTRKLEPLAHQALDPGIASSTYWMFFRLGLSAALANDRPIEIQLPMLPLPSLPILSRVEEVRERTRAYAHVLLWLCGKALMLYHQQTSPGQFVAPQQLLDSWLDVFDAIEQWYHLRPHEFQPMVDLGVDDQLAQAESGFPLLLFANGTGAFCNQLYHTAMLLLLQCKPRTALLGLQSITLSPLWHSQRICGIALNNDRRESWDPCLIASFLVAARRMTHESQQQEILEGFERVRDITGWDMDGYLTQLREDWSFLDGF